MGVFSGATWVSKWLKLTLPRYASFRYCVKTISGHNDWIRSVLPSSDGALFISCSVDQVRAATASTPVPWTAG